MSDIVERLRGVVRVPITDGLGPAGGEEPDNADFFVRTFPTSPLANEAADHIAAMREEIDLLRARAPRAFIMTRKAEWMRMFREAIGFLRTCRRQHHGTDLDGRRHLIGALEAAMKELGEPESERRARAITELRADDQTRASNA
ncbi:MAG: hypothetical protein AB7J28_15830 [Hyphomonadaceae bacterium]